MGELVPHKIFDEQDPACPDDPYGLSKREAEQRLKARVFLRSEMGASGIPFLISSKGKVSSASVRQAILQALEVRF